MNQVIVCLEGRCGNQLFQYAAARAVAIKNNSELIIDTRMTTDAGGQWQYSLNHFNISARIAKPSELPPHRSKKIRYRLWRKYGNNPKYIKEHGHNIRNNEHVYSASANSYLEGYFQSEKYFIDISKIIRKELTIITPPLQYNKIMLDRIVNENAISLHVRRGDYLLPHWSRWFAKCGNDYYNAAISYITRYIKSPIFYIFSDDPKWVKGNIQINYPVIVSENNQNDLHYEDLRLMSSCKHNIIANSTFSWWGAWINTNPDKIVIAPQSWYSSTGPENPDIVPQSWIRLANM